MKKPQHPQAKAATRKQLASHGAGGGSGGAAPAKPSHPNAKAAKAAKHRAASKKKTAAAAHKPRKWSPDESVALCSARAVAEAVRLASGPILSDAAVLDLYWSVADDADAGACIWCTLSAAPVAGLSWEPVDHTPEPSVELISARQRPAPLVLGLGLGHVTHAVTVDLDGTWWSWGEPHTAADFPGAVIEEAWLVCAG